jgi:hypothetical protein
MLTIPRLFVVVMLGLPYAILHRRGKSPSTPLKAKIAKASGLFFALVGAFFAAIDACGMIAHVQTRRVLISHASSSAVDFDPITNPVGYVLFFAAHLGWAHFFTYLARKIWRGQRI